MKTQQTITETHVDYVKIGALLREARQEMKITSEEVAASLRFRQPWVDAIEAGDLTAFPSMVYAKGYIANYAKLLGLESVLQRPPVKEVVVEVPEPARKHFLGSDDGATPPAKVVQKVVQSTPLAEKIALGYEATHVVATSSVRDRRAQRYATERGIRGLYWVLILALLGVIGWMLQDRMDQQKVVVSDVREVPKEEVPAEVQVVRGERVVMDEGLELPTWLVQDCTPVNGDKQKQLLWPACYALHTPYYQRTLDTLLQFQYPMMVTR